ncbi:alpha-(1,3)-fucosyltransferase C-like [Saccostrea echinata]|uniref:alpha-(1,3)-fucosyltransferase C-like n=1 Tax=Saccostrea echinata TaxID=191078 RepID=UPI002A7EAE84|nr:alpha-(1,3)-fucosyltransferase C-like [Saccostrea echinata]
MTVSVSNNSYSRIYRTFWFQAEGHFVDHLRYYDSSKCSVPNCILETNISNADIVIFSHKRIPKRVIKKEKGQIWVFNTAESPYHTVQPNKEWMGLFDLSMSYMEESDIYVPLYGKLQKVKEPVIKNYTGIFSKKTKDAVWVSGHCPTPSKREKLVEELSKYLKVDTYGRCGTKKCGKQYDNLNGCQSMFERDYKFFFSFENSLCKGYTTEKLFALYLNRANLVPVINGPKGAAHYLPKGTYINSQDFASVSLLAKELIRIGSNETQYIRYLKEKDKFIPQPFQKTVFDAQCDLCKYVREVSNGKKVRKNKSWLNVLNPDVYCTMEK